MRRPNDVGGLPAGPIGPRGHEPEPRERLLTAVVSTVDRAPAPSWALDLFYVRDAYGKAISEDDEKKSLDDVQKLTDSIIGKVDELQKKKDQDLLVH